MDRDKKFVKDLDADDQQKPKKVDMPTEPTFHTPEEVAAKDKDSPALNTNNNLPAGKENYMSKFHKWLKPTWPPTKRQLIISAIIAVLAIGGGLAFALTRKHQENSLYSVGSSHKPNSKYVPSKLTGLPVDPSVNKKPVTGVMIENSLDARPQSGLRDAGVVFEAIAEGGITRFLALYLDKSPKNVGPIRSARPYYLQWALGFDAPLAHVGGSPEALNSIRAWHVKDLDEFANSGYYHRVTSRYAPHNMYTSLAQLHKLEKVKGYKNSTFPSFARKDESPSKHPSVTSIDFNYSGYYYNVHYAYNPKTNSYRRFEGGAAHKDANSNKQISPKVVIALVMPYHIESDGYHSYYNTLGKGPMYVFQDGRVIKGNWRKNTKAGQFRFTDSHGKPIKLDAGQTWIGALGSRANLSYHS